MATENDETLANPKLAATTLRVRAVKLEVTAGPDAGRRARVDRPRYVVGTGDTADLRLTDTTISREHLRLSLSPDGVSVHDGGSKNGTWMGGARLASATLTADTVLMLGTTTITLELERDPLDLPLSESSTFGDAIGVSTSMRHLFAVL